MSGREGIFLLFLLESGKMTRVHIFQFESSRFPFFSWKPGRKILGIGKPGWEGAAPLLLLIIDYKSL